MPFIAVSIHAAHNLPGHVLFHRSFRSKRRHQPPCVRINKIKLVALLRKGKRVRFILSVPHARFCVEHKQAPFVFPVAHADIVFFSRSACNSVIIPHAAHGVCNAARQAPVIGHHARPRHIKQRLVHRPKALSAPLLHAPAADRADRKRARRHASNLVQHILLEKNRRSGHCCASCKFSVASHAHRVAVR